MLRTTPSFTHNTTTNIANSRPAYSAQPQRQGLKMSEGVEEALRSRFEMFQKGRTSDLENRLNTAISQIKGLDMPSLSLNSVDDGMSTLRLSTDSDWWHWWRLYMWDFGQPVEEFVAGIELLATKLAKFQSNDSPDQNYLLPLVPLQELEHELMRLNRPDKLKHDYQLSLNL
jgi:hypothetical protein